jgi:ribosome recycling factor
MKKEEKHIQEFTDKFCREIDELFAAKEKEVMTV